MPWKGDLFICLLFQFPSEILKVRVSNLLTLPSIAVQFIVLWFPYFPLPTKTTFSTLTSMLTSDLFAAKLNGDILSLHPCELSIRVNIVGNSVSSYLASLSVALLLTPLPLSFSLSSVSLTPGKVNTNQNGAD